MFPVAFSSHVSKQNCQLREYRSLMLSSPGAYTSHENSVWFWAVMV